MNIGKALVAIRRERSMTQKEVAIIAGISNTYLSDIEKDKKSPDLNVINAICQALNVPISLLLFKAINEDKIQDSEKQRLVREIRPYFDAIARELYFRETPLPIVFNETPIVMLNTNDEKQKVRSSGNYKSDEYSQDDEDDSNDKKLNNNRIAINA